MHYATLKAKKRQGQSNQFALEANTINEYFPSIGSVLAAQIEPQNQDPIQQSREEFNNSTHECTRGCYIT